MKKILKNAGILLSGNVTSNLFSVLCTLLMARSLSVEVFGYYVLAIGYVEVMAKLFSFQTWQAFIRYASLKKTYVSIRSLIKCGFMIDALSLAMATIVAGSILPLVFSIFSVPAHLEIVFYILVLTVPLKFVESAVGVFRFYEVYRAQSIIAALASFIKLAFVGYVFCTEALISNYAWAVFLSQVVSVCLTLWLLKLTLNSNGIGVLSVINSDIKVKNLQKFGYFNFVIYNNFDISIRMISRYLDVFLLGRIYGAEAVAALKIAKEISSVIAKLLEPIYQTLYPELAKMLHVDEQKKAIDTAKKIATFVAVSSAVFYMGFVVVGGPLIKSVIGEGYDSAYAMACIYLLATLLAASTMPIYPFQHALGMAKQAFLNQMSATLFYVPLCVLLTMGSEYGAAFAYVGYYLFLSVISIISLRRALLNGKLFH